jgi:phage N-6-adenine-methyltransferase
MVAPVTTLARINEAQRALTAAKTLDDVLQIRDQAEALRVYVKAVSESLDAANMAAEIKLRAERKAGEMLAAMEKNKGAAAPTRLHDATTLDELGIEKTQSSRWQREAKVPEETFVEYISTCQEANQEITQAGLLKIANGSHVSLNSGENEWYTPPEYIEAARSAMGSIDLDPATCEVAQANVRAKRFYYIDDNGLEKKWTGNVWLNPPYSKDLIGLFMAKVVEESNRFKQAIILVNNATDTAWFHDLLSVASALCLIKGRIKFLDKTGKPANTPVQGQAAVYVGDDPDSFCKVFAGLGAVAFLAPTEEAMDGR